MQPGSIYHALKKLTEEGLLGRSAPSRWAAGRRGPRYEVTPKGEEQFEDLLRRYWWEQRDGRSRSWPRSRS